MSRKLGACQRLERKFLVAENSEKYHLSRKIGEIEGALAVEMHKRHLLKKQRIKQENMKQFGQELGRNADYVNSIPGPRVLSIEQVRRISRELDLALI